MQAKHEGQIRRLNRIEGQVRGIRKMVEEGRYCIEVANQVKAVRSALKQVALTILDTHLRTCVSTAIRSRKSKEIDTKIGEVMRLVQSWDG